MKKNFHFFSSYKYIILSVFILIVSAIGVSYALSNGFLGNNTSGILSGFLRVSLNESSSLINSINMVPMSDAEGLSSTTNVYEFSISNEGSIDAAYQIRLAPNFNATDEDVIQELDFKYVRYAIKVDDGSYSSPASLDSIAGGNVLYSGTLNTTNNATKTFKLKLWLDMSAGNDIMNKSFAQKIEVNSSQLIASNFLNPLPPTIFLNGGDMQLKKGDTFVDPGVEKIVDNYNAQLSIINVSERIQYFDVATSSLTTVMAVDTSRTGIYYITYSVVDNSGNTGTKIRTVVVNEKANITMVLTGSSPIIAYKGYQYHDPGVTATDMTSNGLVNISSKVVTIGYVNTSVIGTYYIRYAVVDDEGSYSSVTRQVDVRDLISDNYGYSFLNGTITDYDALTYGTNVVIPSTIDGVTVTSIGVGAFKNKNLTSVTIPSTVTTILPSSFEGNNLTTITVPESVGFVGENAFKKSATSNSSLSSMVNQTGLSLNWGTMTGGTGEFISGTVTHPNGNIVVSQ